MWRNKHFNFKKDKYNRDQYVKWRNKVVKLRYSSINNYFHKKCSGRTGGKDFFNTIKPFLSDKSSGRQTSNILLCENDKIISEPALVTEVFNKYYSSLAEYKNVPDSLDNLPLEQIINKHAAHQSIEMIKSNVNASNTFDFHTISYDVFLKYVRNLTNKKSCGYDGIQAKFLKLSGIQFIESLCYLFNECINSSVFPSDMKCSEINPIFKKGDSMSKNNYRSVNLLPVVSKIFERIMSDQLVDYFSNVLSKSF